MKVGVYLVWLKRILFLSVIAAVVAGMFAWSPYMESRKKAAAERYAPVTAKVWVASALYRNDPDRFIVCRDSILKAEGISTEQLQEYIRSYSKKPERYKLFTHLAKRMVDSLVQIEHSRRQESEQAAGDSVEVSLDSVGLVSPQKIIDSLLKP